MSRILENREFLFLLRLVSGGLFVYAGALKILKPEGFADSIVTFELLPHQFINLVALGLPPFEVIAGVMLVAGFQVRAAAFSLMTFTVIFAAAIIQALVRGLEVDCGCFGSGEPSVMKTWSSLGRDLLLLAACGIVYRSRIVGRHASESQP